jgi:hypothetical protein
LRILIRNLDSGEKQEEILTATILLCSYEIIATQGEEHRRHLYGAKLLILNRQISASSNGLDRANFWIYVRHDITVALFNKTTLQISPEEWNVTWQTGAVDEGTLGNQLLWFLGKTIDVVFSQEQDDLTIPLWCKRRQDIHAEVAAWFDARPPSLRELRYGGPDDGGFSKVFFPVPSAGSFSPCFYFARIMLLTDCPEAAAIMWYHLLHIILYAEPRLQHPSQLPLV